MDTREFVARLLERGVDRLFEAARLLPEDRLDWQPECKGRSALDQLQECAYMPRFYVRMLTDRVAPEMNSDFMERYETGRKSFRTLDECEAAGRQGTQQVLDLLRALPDGDMDVRLWRPFWGGAEYSLPELVMLHYWNLSYHKGQITYIGSILRD